MSIESDEERIAKKAFELWEAEGHPHGRDKEHWDAAKEILAIKESADVTLLPRDFGAEEPVEEKSVAIDNEGQAPNLTDTGEHDLTAIEREPAVTAPPSKAKAVAKKSSAGDVSKSEKPQGKSGSGAKSKKR